MVTLYALLDCREVTAIIMQSLLHSSHFRVNSSQRIGEAAISWSMTKPPLPSGYLLAKSSLP